MKKTTKTKINQIVTTVATGMALTVVGHITPINLINDASNLIKDATQFACDITSVSTDKILFADSECCGPYHQCQCPSFSG